MAQSAVPLEANSLLIQHRRMPRRQRYEPSHYPPYASADELKRRIAVHMGAVDSDGCRAWQGCARHSNHGIIRVKTPTGSSLLCVRRVVWFLEHGIFPKAADRLVPTCGRPWCMSLPHIEMRPYKPVLTPEQVAEAKRLYAAGQVPRDIDGQLRTSAVTMVAYQLGVAKETVRRVADGRRCMPHLWVTEESDEARVRQLLAEKEQLAQQRRENNAQRWTVRKLAAKYNVSMSLMTLVVSGLKYDESEVAQ